MEFIYSTVEENSNSRNISIQVPHLQRQISALARQERILKMRLRNHPRGINYNIRHIRKKICKLARFKRKVTIIQTRFKEDLHQCICTVQRIVKYYRDTMLPVNLQTAAESHQRYDIIENDTTSMEATSSRHANKINSHPQTVVRTKPWNFGPPTYICTYCGAMLWYGERIQKSRNTSKPKFTFCCMEGRVQIPLLRKPPALLDYLHSSESGQKGIKFMENIRAYNCMFAITSLGVRVNSAINKTRGPYVFRVSGVNIHFIGSLVPEKGEKPKYAQLYIYDTTNEVRNRIGTMQKNGPNAAIDEEIVTQLSHMLDQTNNHLVKSFRQARDRYNTDSETSFHLRIPSSRAQDGRQYDMPTSSEIAGLIVGDVDKKRYERDVIVHHRIHGPQQISDLHPSYMAMTYPLIHPYGEDGYRLGITLRDGKNLSMCQYYCFRLQQRLNEGHTLLRSGRLLQQYIVDCYMTIEEERFRWIRLNQKKLRSDLYSGLMDAVHRGDSDCAKVGKSIILPSSHTGGPRTFWKSDCKFIHN
ncbi:putative helitron helicase-like domain-containing protein [Heracleum sosnowskyi]|uniref:Helitron helicase-like domain-containing protein n=1 Tax=Heracleum sosnowskyi TaxID=360622 RepID=A0AAD8HBI6_9APIA|nr:putative helitron helicase-like domain-containing protein [Heracleum sosnowskyi]